MQICQHTGQMIELADREITAAQSRVGLGRVVDDVGVDVCRLCPEGPYPTSHERRQLAWVILTGPVHPEHDAVDWGPLGPLAGGQDSSSSSVTTITLSTAGRRTVPLLCRCHG